MDDSGTPEDASKSEDTGGAAGPSASPATESPGAPAGQSTDRSRGRSQESIARAVGVAIGLGTLGLLVPLVVITTLALVVLSLDPPALPILIGLLVVGQFALFVVVGVGYLRWSGLDRRGIVSYLGVGMPSLKDIGLILVTWVVMMVAMLVTAVAVTTVLPELLGEAGQTEPAENPVAGVIEANPELIVIGIIGMFLVVGPAEEILFRGVIQNRLRERLSAIPAIVIASAIFAGAHVVALAGQDPVAVAMTLTILFVPAIGLGAIYEYTGNIVVPSLLHGFHNSMILLAVWSVSTADAMLIWPDVVGALH